ncbi:MurR/RpiR family transcriptional regulator [Citrobacter amalonaticus]|uniref:MurR/RpiR family transcriptional regulator n=1 Tax=Citrobacter amalonaticus TaxID=35703 RepID=UPI00076AFDA3|nr:MurR/RpiR family transcriptional regulator [Citrobacter amalonaticus]HAT6801274.1 SIS domain-containing protein [Citrobacter freundii]AMG91620.1 MurR/RpiR family transcriptional regulator [Citrobacter amalonaticus]ELK6623731.1 MurR/RpiR family transcriptional regulator [Citrobacter amalonaticus]MBJ9276107.1 MurR/RpiR family transcriptional regulator [Citrobacter amalonaticus]MDL4619778.1 MurR/RpiR family transcriptional regulator [Citrobacter amalonaticus]
MYRKKTLSLDEYHSLTKDIGELTESEYRLNEYINKHFNELPYHGIVDLSQNASVSKATIGRFLNKVGFTGYADFKRALDTTLSENKISAPYEKNSRQRNKGTITTEHIVDAFTQKVSSLFAGFKKNININNLNDFIQLVLNDQRHIYVVGPSSSHAMAIHFCTLLKYFRSNISLLPTDISELPKCLIDIKEDDVLIVFSYYRFNRVALNIAKWFKKKNATVVLVTNSEANPYGKFCELQFVLPSDAQSVFQSRIIGFFFIELILHLAYEKGDSEGNFAQLEELFLFFETFSAS